MSINERLKILIDRYEGGTVLRFAKKIGIPHTTVAGMLPGSRESKPGFEIIAKILDAYPQVSSDWLVKGVGELSIQEKAVGGNSGQWQQFNPSHDIRVGGAAEAKDNSTQPTDNGIVQFLMDQIKELQQEKAELKEELRKYRNRDSGS